MKDMNVTSTLVVVLNLDVFSVGHWQEDVDFIIVLIGLVLLLYRKPAEDKGESDGKLERVYRSPVGRLP